jgi:hypothetical protein
MACGVVWREMILPSLVVPSKLLATPPSVLPVGRWKRLATSIIINTLERSVNSMDELF